MVKRRKLKILILGGRGFVGSALCKKLKNHTVYTFDRKPGGLKHYQGEITNIHHVGAAVAGKDVVVNLIGLTPAKDLGYETYRRVHVDGARNVVIACKSHKVKRLIHMSALGAHVRGLTDYLKTKGQGEKIVLDSGLKVTIFCPSLIFDTKNELIAQLSKLSITRQFPLIKSKLQPVYRQDIAELFKLAVIGKIKDKKLEVGGPDKLTLYEIAKKVYNSKGRACLPIPLTFVKPGMHLAKIFGWFGVGKDQITSLNLDNVTSSKKASKYVKLTSIDSWLKKSKL